jgi:hypothetical protein
MLPDQATSRIVEDLGLVSTNSLLPNMESGCRGGNPFPATGLVLCTDRLWGSAAKHFRCCGLTGSGWAGGGPTQFDPEQTVRNCTGRSYLAFLFSVSNRSLAAGPDEAGF